MTRHMIVRINQFGASPAEANAGWPDGPRTGPIACPWSDDTYGFEILILDTDERNQPLTRSFRQRKLRELIPRITGGLRGPCMSVVVRLDAEMTRQGLLPVFGHLADRDDGCRFGVSEMLQCEPDAPPVQGSIRLTTDDAQLAALCADPALPLESSLRLRAFAVPEALVPPLLDVSDLDDERWAEILPAASFMLQTTRGLETIHVLTARFDPPELRRRVTERLVEMARD